MSGRRRRWLMLDVSATLDLREFGHEAVGAALLLVCWEAGGHIATDDDHLARVCGLSRAKYRKRAVAIMGAREALKRNAFAKATLGRQALSKATRERILERDGRECCYCGDTGGPFHIDHVVPVARGGNDDDENLCVACAPCNFAKSASLNSEWSW